MAAAVVVGVLCRSIPCESTHAAARAEVVLAVHPEDYIVTAGRVQLVHGADSARGGAVVRAGARARGDCAAAHDAHHGWICGGVTGDIRRQGARGRGCCLLRFRAGDNGARLWNQVRRRANHVAVAPIAHQAARGRHARVDPVHL